MEGLIVGSGTTNPVHGSVVTIQLQDRTCMLAIPENKFGDRLPMIPSESRVVSGRVLYRLCIDAVLIDAQRRPIEGAALSLRSSRSTDRLTVVGKTDKLGKVQCRLESREPGAARVLLESDAITCAPLEVELLDAWYESAFLITGYNVCDEADFTGELVEAIGLDEKHKEDFLFSVAGVPMQGTGKGSTGKYIRLDRLKGGWHRNASGLRDWAAEPASVSFKYSDGARGAYAIVREGHSIAVDPTVIPPHSKVEIDGVGERYADDKGSSIKLFHIDNFLGAGKQVVSNWLHGGVNGTHRRVKYVGKPK